MRMEADPDCETVSVPARVGISFPSHEDGSRSSLRNVVFSSYLEFRTLDKVHKPSDSEYMLFVFISKYYAVFFVQNGAIGRSFTGTGDDFLRSHFRRCYLYLFACECLIKECLLWWIVMYPMNKWLFFCNPILFSICTSTCTYSDM
jgi:hypothetical protein